MNATNGTDNVSPDNAGNDNPQRTSGIRTNLPNVKPITRPTNSKPVAAGKITKVRAR